MAASPKKAAVSTRRTMGPSVTGENPASSAMAVSWSVKSPSGPTSRAALRTERERASSSTSLTGRTPGTREDHVQPFRRSAAQPFRKGNGSRNLGKRVLAALLAGLQGDALPLLPLGLLLPRVQAHDRAVRQERNDGGNAQFHGFLNDEVHVGSFGDRLAQRQMGQFWSGRTFLPRSQQHPGTARRFRHHGMGGAAATVKDDAGITLFQAQNLGGMVRLIPAQLPGGSGPFRSREVKASHA